MFVSLFIHVLSTLYIWLLYLKNNTCGCISNSIYDYHNLSYHLLICGGIFLPSTCKIDNVNMQENMSICRMIIFTCRGGEGARSKKKPWWYIPETSRQITIIIMHSLDKFLKCKITSCDQINHNQIAQLIKRCTWGTVSSMHMN